MELKLKIEGKDNVMRVETKARIEEVMINEDLVGNHENIAVCFRSGNSSGIIDLTTKELDELINTVNKRVHLIKSTKKFRAAPEEVPF